MTPQSNFMVLAPLADGQEDALRSLLASMNLRPGVVDPHNALVPFGEFERLHFARFVIVDAPTAADITVYGLPIAKWPVSLAFLGDCDGPADTFLAELVARAGPGLRRIFAFCQGFAPEGDLLDWMKRHEQPPAANYINWIGRTVLQVREEAALREALVDHLQTIEEEAGSLSPRQLHERLSAFVAAERRAGRLTLTPEAPTPFGWWLRNLLHMIGVPIALLILAPFLLIASPVLAYMLRRRETTDPDIDPRPDPDHVARLADLEDHEFTNQFTVFGDLKPGRFRRWTTSFLLWLLNYSARHIYNRGYLTRVQTIHFARWVFLDDKKRLFFASNYDGSLESYMDDFINKVAWGINLVFSNGVGYPRTDWLIKGGARDEQKYKRVLRRHQLPTDVWYNAHPGLTAIDLARNSRIRAGIERPAMPEGEARQWLEPPDRRHRRRAAASRGRLRRRAGPRPLRPRAAERGELLPAQGGRSRRRAALAAERTGHQRRDDGSAARHGAAGRLHPGRLASTRRFPRDHRGLLGGVPERSRQRGQPFAPARRRRRQRAREVAMGRQRGQRAASGRHDLCAAGRARSLGGSDQGRRLG